MSFERRERLRAAITAWHETRIDECVASSEGQACCCDAPMMASNGLMRGGLDGLLDAIERGLGSE